MESNALSSTGTNGRYTYADALRRLGALGFGPDAPRPAPPPAEALNDWLFAREITELSAWFENEPLDLRAPAEDASRKDGTTDAKNLS